MCQDDDATFTCVLFVPSGGAVAPGWLRNFGGVDMMRHTIVSNLTDSAVGPVYVSSTITVNNVTVVDDDGVLYQCDVFTQFSSNYAVLTVIGMQVYSYVCTYVRMYVLVNVFMWYDVFI